ncbi:hypothetical protein, partial [uncultured Bacteroides sp.]|uniref:hypothetical protein n=1 Tax=uncultured Bacteroides sp. TaxID=162156 RepID=UPI00259ADB27
TDEFKREQRMTQFILRPHWKSLFYSFNGGVFCPYFLECFYSIALINSELSSRFLSIFNFRLCGFRALSLSQN